LSEAKAMQERIPWERSFMLQLHVTRATNLLLGKAELHEFEGRGVQVDFGRVVLGKVGDLGVLVRGDSSTRERAGDCR